MLKGSNSGFLSYDISGVLRLGHSCRGSHFISSIHRGQSSSSRPLQYDLSIKNVTLCDSFVYLVQDFLRRVSVPPQYSLQF